VRVRQAADIDSKRGECAESEFGCSNLRIVGDTLAAPVACYSLLQGYDAKSGRRLVECRRIPPDEPEASSAPRVTDAGWGHPAYNMNGKGWR